MVGGLLYVSNGLGFAEAIDPATGKTVWVQNIPPEAVVGGAKRGVAYWGEGAEARILSYTGTYLYALNPKTGEPAANHDLFLRGYGADLVPFTSAVS